MPNTQSESRCCEKCYPYDSTEYWCRDSTCPCHVPDPMGDFLRSRGHKVIDVTPDNSQAKECSTCKRAAEGGAQCMTHNPPFRIPSSPQEGWSEKFDNEFPSPDGHDFMDNERISSVKRFIRTTIASELSEYKKNLVEKVEGMKQLPPQDACYQGWTPQELQDAQIHDVVLDDLIAIIKNN